MSFATSVTQWDRYTVPAAAADGIDPNLVRAVMTAESGGVPQTSKAGAIGLMQLMPDTASGLHVGNPWDPQQNIQGGADYLKQLTDRFGAGNLDKILAGYNAGPNAVDKYGGVPPYQETQAYVKRVEGLLAASGSSTTSATTAGTATPATSTATAQACPAWVPAWLCNAVNAVPGSTQAGALGAATQKAATGDLGATIATTAQNIALELTIGAVFLALIAGGFAIAASPNSVTVAV